MRAIILAAGRGSRMGMLTDGRPKCLTPLAGKPLLQWQLEALHAAGIDEIAVVRGYKSDMLSGPGYAGFESPRWAETNMVVSLSCAEEWLRSGPCVVSYSDIVYHPGIVKALMETGGDIVISYDRLWDSLWQERFMDPLSDAETFQAAENGRLLEIGRRAKSRDEIQGQYMGLLKFTSAGWRQVDSFLKGLPPFRRDKLDMTGLLRLLLEEGVAIQTRGVDGQWCEVDSQEDVQVYESRLQSGRPWLHDWRS